MRRKLAVRTLAVWVGLAALCASGAAQAQQTTSGAIIGTVRSAVGRGVLAGVTVIATSPALQAEQVSVTDDRGSFRLTLLPPGTYSLHFESAGFRPADQPGVIVEVGRTVRIDFDIAPETVEAPRVIVRDRAPTVDQESTALGENVRRELLENTPSPRTYSQVTQLAPGSSSDRTGTTVLGSTGLENIYVIDGLNTTGILLGELNLNMPIEFFEQIALNTAGYMPEFGGGNGGFFSLVLRTGGNDVHGDFWSYMSSRALSADPVPFSRRGESIERRDLRDIETDSGFTLRAPIIQDKLWLFVGLDIAVFNQTTERTVKYGPDANGNLIVDDDPNDGDLLPDWAGAFVNNYSRTRQDIYYVAKLTYNLNPDHRLSVSMLGSSSNRGGVLRGLGIRDNGLNGDPTFFLGTRAFGSLGLVANWSSRLVDVGQLEVTAGYYRSDDGFDLPEASHHQDRIIRFRTSIAGSSIGDTSNCPVQGDDICPVTNYNHGGFGFVDAEHVSRLSLGARMTHFLSSHQVRYGFNMEYLTVEAPRYYTSGFLAEDFNGFVQERSFMTEDATQPFGVDLFNDNRPFGPITHGLNMAAFAQDSWNVFQPLTVNFGLRWDYQGIYDASGQSVLTLPTSFAPRIGAIFDPTRRGRAKIFASYGWYFETMPLDIADRSFSGEGLGFREVDSVTGQPRCSVDPGGPMNSNNPRYLPCFDAAGNPVPGAEQWWVLGGTNSEYSRNILGQYHDEISIGGEYEVMRDVSVGVTGIMRQLRRVIEDTSVDEANNYFITNPGGGLSCQSIDNDFQPGTANETLCAGFPSPRRDYLGLIFTAKKRLSNHYQFLASYTLSRLSGNFPGLYSVDNDQQDPNISSTYDLVTLLTNREGRLPGDHTHNFKFAGSYEFGGVDRRLAGLTLGLTTRVESGGPTNYLARHAVYGLGESFLLPRGSGPELPWIFNVDFSVNYEVAVAPGVKLALNLSIFNVFNFQEATRVDESYTIRNADPIPNGTVADLQNLQVQNRVGSPVRHIDPSNPDDLNPNFGQAVARQLPRYARIGLKLSF